MLNPTQKNILDGIMVFIFDPVSELSPPTFAINVLKAMISPEEPSQDEQHDMRAVWPCIKQIRDVFNHPCPQNRSESYPYFHAPDDSNMVVYKNEEGKPAFEQRGLLSLTSRAQEGYDKINKQDVVDYITSLINKEIAEYEKLVGLDPYQIQTLKLLKEKGLQTKDLHDWNRHLDSNGRKIKFLNEHQETLVYLIQEQKLEPAQAILEIAGLDFRQANAIKAGLPRVDVMKLPGFYSTALVALHQFGFNVKNLEYYCSCDKAKISQEHIATLRYLVANHFSPMLAIDEIKDLDKFQAAFLRKGFKRHEVLGLSFWALLALLELQPKLTGSQLRSFQSQDGGGVEYFGEWSYKALIYLVQSLKINPEQAIDGISGIGSEACRAITQGIPRSQLEMIGFNHELYPALIALKDDGLRAEHLKDWDSKFSNAHLEALKYLIRKGNLSPAEAVKIIVPFDSETLTEFAKEKYARLLNRQPRPAPRSLIHANLSDEQQHIQEAVDALQDYGVTEEVIRENWISNDPNTIGWGQLETNTLIYLVTGDPRGEVGLRTLPETLRLSAIDALREMTSLCAGRLRAVYRLYVHGLRGERLLNWNSDVETDKVFTLGHCEALIALIEDKDMLVYPALERIWGIREEAAWEIYRDAVNSSAITTPTAVSREHPQAIGTQDVLPSNMPESKRKRSRPDLLAQEQRQAQRQTLSQAMQSQLSFSNSSEPIHLDEKKDTESSMLHAPSNTTQRLPLMQEETSRESYHEFLLSTPSTGRTSMLFRSPPMTRRGNLARQEEQKREVSIHLPQQRTLNFWQNTALEYLQARGLTADMLLTRNEGGHLFREQHCYALTNWIDRNRTITAALQAIDGLSSSQAGGIQNGLEREDVINLTNFWHITALEKLKQHGLTSTMLLTRNEGGHAFNEDHCYALTNLVENRQFSIADALHAIDGLSQEDARRLTQEGEELARAQSTFSY